MSELKAFEVTRKALFGRTCTEKVYLKSEADKVIAELKNEINRKDGVQQRWFAFKKPSELKDGVQLTRYPRVRFDMCTFTYKEDK